MSDEEGHDSSKSEAELKMEMQRKKQQEKEAEEIKEYEEQRQAERSKEEDDIRKLKERRDQRKKEREEEERRLAEMRQAEEQRRKQEEDERLRRKREEEAMKKEAIERKQREAQERMSNIGKRNFVIEKKSRDGTSVAQEEQPSGIDLAKSKEQLEAEKREILKQRIQSINIDGVDNFSESQLTEKAKEIWNHIYRLESDKYDLEARYKKQRDDMSELAERARQINKGGKGKQSMARQEPDQMSEKFTGAPPKVQMYSPYERVKDRRTFVDRRTLYTGPMYAEEAAKIEPGQGSGKPASAGEEVAASD